jgi:hypothetical protein
LVPFNNGTQGQSARTTNNSAGNLTGVVGVATSSATSGLSVSVALSGAVSCTFDSAVSQGDFVQASSSSSGHCTDAGPTYPSSNQVVGIALSSSNSGSTGTSQTVYLFGAEVLRSSAASTVYAVGASPTAPVGNGSAISGTSTVYWLANNATATLPAATTAGQTVIVIDASSGFSGSISVTRTSSDTIFDWAASDSAQTTVGPYQTMTLISDGNGHWYVMHHN